KRRDELNNLIFIFAESNIDPKARDEYLLLLWKAKFNIPFLVNTADNSPLFWAIKSLAERVDISHAEENKSIIQAFAKSAYSSYIKISDTDKKKSLERELYSSIDLAIALDNSKETLRENYGGSQCDIFAAILNGFYEAENSPSNSGQTAKKFEKQICDLL